MKKLNLKLGGIQQNMLTKEQMKKITGGYDMYCSNVWTFNFGGEDQQPNWPGYQYIPGVYWPCSGGQGGCICGTDVYSVACIPEWTDPNAWCYSYCGCNN